MFRVQIKEAEQNLKINPQQYLTCRTESQTDAKLISDVRNLSSVFCIVTNQTEMKWEQW